MNTLLLINANECDVQIVERICCAVIIITIIVAVCCLLLPVVKGFFDLKKARLQRIVISLKMQTIQKWTLKKRKLI